ncbi:hypothetical protein [Lignipirellula cremea]|uniref:Uncharacterized protein n=1 Tax=Lignipirellula cremea TaxID=2528010 RepID=A0A518DKA0_9BACT|nr:hypothetical protein [Lignipirellula cremea]QDU92262.1 hypothetical protein Pla8534_00070 [Lignipirellula cremea]
MFEADNLHDFRSEKIAALVTPFQDRGDDWKQRLQRIMSWGIAHKSDAMSKLYVAMIRDGKYDDFKSMLSGDSDFWTKHHNAAKEHPRFMIDVLAVWFERTAMKYDDGKAINFMDQCGLNHSHGGAIIVAEAGQADPEYFADRMLPVVRAIVLRTLLTNRPDGCDRAWPYITGRTDFFDINDATLEQLAVSLEILAKEKPGQLRDITNGMATEKSETYGHLLLRAWTANPLEFADECVDFFLQCKQRLDIGRAGIISRQALTEISKYCSMQNFSSLESFINGFCTEYERRYPQIRGSDELHLLRCLAADRVSERTKGRIETLERKFPELLQRSLNSINSTGRTAERSSIPDEKVSLLRDKNWIAVMRKYPGSRAVGKQLREASRRERVRFGNLALQMEDDIHPIFFSSILDGISSRYFDLEQQERVSDAVERQGFALDLLEKLLVRVHRLPKHPCGSAIVTTIGEFAKRSFSNHTLSILSHYAVKDPSPSPRESVSDFGRESLMNEAFGTVRGQAARTVSQLLFADETRFVELASALSSLVCDDSMAVRAAAIQAVLPVLSFDYQRAIYLFTIACRDKPEIASASTWKEFCYDAVQMDPEAILPIIEEAFRSNIPESVKNATVLIAHADLLDVDTGTLLDEARWGTEDMRRKLASVYASNFDNELVGKKCQESLGEYYDDRSEKVREQVGSAFNSLSGQFLQAHESELLVFVASKSFETDAVSLLMSMERSAVQLPEVICSAAERILSFLGEEGTHIAYHGSFLARNISKLVVRQYEQTQNDTMKVRCLDLIDKMERGGYWGMSDELSRLDR